jgi:hypothetical protein
MVGLYVWAPDRAYPAMEYERRTGRGVEVTYNAAGGAANFIRQKVTGSETSATIRIRHRGDVQSQPLRGLEGELGAMLATTPIFSLVSWHRHQAPNMLNYTANIVASPWAGGSVVPYAPGGSARPRCSSAPPSVSRATKPF